MILYKKYRLTIVSIAYWLLLFYVTAALLWWFIALNNQNNAMAGMRLISIEKDDPAYLQKASAIADAQKRKTAQYVGEGLTFFLVIAIAAFYVYRATKKQLKFSQQQQNFMMAITHELKTPIAITQLNIETLLKRKLGEEQQHKLLKNTLKEADRLNTLCNNILTTSQLESGLNKMHANEIDLSSLILVCIKNYQRNFSEAEFSHNIQEDVFIAGDSFLLQMLLNNLTENAIKYSSLSGKINIELNKQKEQIILLVKDNGIGIAADEKEKIFDKFYRIGNESTRTTKGTGLGLYLCKKIVQKHQGIIKVSDNHPSGSIFEVRFKAYDK